MKTFLIIVPIILLFTVSFVSSQTKPDKIVSLKVSPMQKVINSNSSGDIEIMLNIKKGWHINANKPLDSNLIATVLTLKDNPAFKVTGIDYPQPIITKLAFSENDLALYEDEVIITLHIKTAANIKGKKISVEGKVQYQPCNDQTCLFPNSKEFNIDLKVK